MFAFNVWLNNRLIDTVFYSSMPAKTIKASVEDVYSSLVNHDGYDSDIKVTWPKGQTVTEMEWQIQGFYGYGDWECENTETTREAGLNSLKEYRANGSGSYRLKKVRVPKGNHLVKQGVRK